MPGPNMELDIGYKAGGAIVQFTPVKLSADDTVVACTAVTDAVIGVAQQACSAGDATAGNVINVRCSGISRVIAAGTVTRGGAAAPSTGGLAQAAVTTNRAFGTFLTSGVANDQVNVLLTAPTALIP